MTNAEQRTAKFTLTITSIFTTLAGIAGCTTPNPNYRRPHADASVDPSGDPSAMPDSSPDPQTTIRVSPVGNDFADGLAGPVRTIKRAIELASGNSTILAISIDAGTYGLAHGESYPYVVPEGLKILGKSGAVLAGTNTEAGLVLNTGSIQNLELEGFRTAVHVRGVATVTKLTVRASQLGLLIGGTAKLTANDLTFVGDSACKNVGLQALGQAQVIIDTLRSAETLSVEARDQAVVSITKGTVTSSSSKCDSLMIANGKSLVLSESYMSGGFHGITVGFDSKEVEVTLANTTISDTTGPAIFGSPRSFKMTGGELRNSWKGADIIGGTQVFINVAVKGMIGAGIITSNGSEPASIKLRGCTITGNDTGVVTDSTTSDFGSAADPGNNTIKNNRFINVDNPFFPVTITAVGNVWSPGVQGSNAEGKYRAQTILGPVPSVEFTNFGLEEGSSLQF